MDKDTLRQHHQNALKSLPISGDGFRMYPGLDVTVENVSPGYPTYYQRCRVLSVQGRTVRVVDTVGKSRSIVFSERCFVGSTFEKKGVAHGNHGEAGSGQA